MTREKGIILAARLISMAFTPFYLPTVGLVALFMFSYMSQMPWSYKFQLGVQCLTSSVFSVTSSAST